jgi:site-specific recombinase XerD
MWEDWKYGYATYLSLEKAAPENTKDAYLRDLNIFLRFLEENYAEIAPKQVELRIWKRLWLISMIWDFAAGHKHAFYRA